MPRPGYLWLLTTALSSLKAEQLPAPLRSTTRTGATVTLILMQHYLES